MHFGAPLILWLCIDEILLSFQSMQTQRPHKSNLLNSSEPILVQPQPILPFHLQ